MTEQGPHVPHRSEELAEDSQVSDEQLVRRFQESPGSPAGRRAAEQLFARYDERVYAWCRRIVRDHDRALDLAQEGLLIAVRDLPQFEYRSRFSTWLYTVVRRRALRLIGRQRWFAVTDTDLDTLESGSPDPASDVVDQDESQWLQHTLKTELEPHEASALWLRCEEGMAVDDITRVLGITAASGARGVLQSARRKLRAALERRETPRRAAP